MIVDEDHVATALAYLNADPHPVAIARKELTDAENKVKRVFAEKYLAASGSIDARKATAVTSPEYVDAQAAELNATLEYENHRAQVRGAEMLIECWRSEQANVRAAERIR